MQHPLSWLWNFVPFLSLYEQYSASIRPGPLSSKLIIHHQLRRKTAAARLLGSWIRIPPGTWTFVCCECCALSGRGLCNELSTRPEESDRLLCVAVCNIQISWMRSRTQSVVIELNRRCITGCISYMPLIVTVKHDCWMSSGRLQCSGR